MGDWEVGEPPAGETVEILTASGPSRLRYVHGCAFKDGAGNYLPLSCAIHWRPIEKDPRLVDKDFRPGEWLSCEEFLPDDDRTVVCSPSETYFLARGYFDSGTWRRYSESRGDWVPFNTTPAHWMNIPDLPTE